MAIDLSTLDPREALTAIYIGYYDRAADPAGLAFWEDVVGEDGFNLVSITTLFASASETQALFPFFADPSSTTPSAFITQLYQNLFNRDPDADGLAFWTAELQKAVDMEDGALTVGQIITSIIEGAQSEVDGGFPDDTTIMNKIEVALDWTNSLNAAGITFDLDGATGASARGIIDNVDATEASVLSAKSTTDNFIADNTPAVPGQTFYLDEGRDRPGDIGNTEGDDTFEAFDEELQNGDFIDGAGGTDVLEYFNATEGPVVAPTTTSVEQVVITNQVNDLNGQADNNVGGYSTNVGGSLNGNIPADVTIEVDVEIDGGDMSGVRRWEDFDSRADLVIEDARDLNPGDGTFTAEITVAMVSTDPGNVDYAVYFDDPINQTDEFGTLQIQILDQEASLGLPTPNSASAGYLTEAVLEQFIFQFNDTDITVVVPAVLGTTFGAGATFASLGAAIETATEAALAAEGITAPVDLSFGAPVPFGVANQPTIPIILTFRDDTAQISAQPDQITVTGRDLSGNSNTDTGGSLNANITRTTDLITLQVELDDVGKGSMGGDAMFGAMSTGRQFGDDGTSDSIGIQQFNIEVDRSSQLQTINSTNNALEVVNIAHGENDGPNNTTTASDEIAGDLVVRGQANPIDINGGTLLNPFGNAATDMPMPGAVPQHNSFGFSDVRVINANGMTGVQSDGSVGSVDITAELTEEIVEKYLEIQDREPGGLPNGEADDVAFTYTLGAGNDEFLLEMSADALNSAGTGSREDFNMSIDGGAGDDVITTNIGTTYDNNGNVNFNGAQKTIDEQGQDHYLLTSSNIEGWYQNSVSNIAAEFSVAGGAGNDTIWTHGWGDFRIDGGMGADVIYTDNSGAVEAAGRLASNIDRNLLEHDQIDYVTDAVWAFNAENVAGGFPLTMTGITNDTITLGTVNTVPVTATAGVAEFTISYFGAAGSANAGTAYTVTASIPFSELTVNSVTGVVTASEQALNQAMKNAINNDAIMSNLLEAADGPGNSLVVASKSDGDHVAADLTVAYTALSINNGTSPVTLAAFANAGYTAPEFIDLNVGDPGTESDNTITMGSDGANDLVVLSNTDGGPVLSGGLDGGPLTPSDLNGQSNEILEFDNGFGRDTILNFDATAGTNGVVDADEDVLDFDNIFADNTFAATGLVGAIAAPIVDGFITVTAETAANDTLAEIQALYTGFDTAVTAATAEEIVIVFNTLDDNTGTVYSVNDGIAVGDVQVRLEGEISLIGTDWTTLGLDNFA